MIISDFGLSRNLSSQLGEDLTEYVVTRYYRAPEIMLSKQEYTHAVDIWSVGCTFAEMLNRRILFPGENYIQQVLVIISLRGNPDGETLKYITNQQALDFVKQLPYREKVALDTVFKDAPPDALDLLDKMLDMNPNRRISAAEALKHPVFDGLHDEEDEPVYTGPKIDFFFEQDHSLTLVKI